MASIFAYIEHKVGVPDDTSFELIAAAKAIFPAESPVALVAGFGPDLQPLCEQLRGSYAEVWTLQNEDLAYPNAELVRAALAKIVPQGSIVLIPHDHFGLDLAPGLSIKLNAAYVSDVVALDQVQGTTMKAVRQEYGGQISAHTLCDISYGAVITVRPGAFKPLEATTNGTVVDKSPEIGTITAKRRYLETKVAESGDVDITKHAILVSVGRGIQEKDNLRIAQELADALGAAVSCSRPVVDAKWLEKSRQVGTSGKTVKPKVYIACGISGAFQHLAGIKGSPFLVAINKNPKAPIFQVADVGIIDDLLEFLPELTNKVRELHGAAVK